MNDAEFEAQKVRIKALIEKWHAPVGLRWWTVTHQYVVAAEDMPEDAGTEVLAKATVRWQYLRAEIVWNMRNVEDCDDDYLEKAFVHECMHVLLNEMRSHTDDLLHEERVASSLANAFLWTRDVFSEKREEESVEGA